MKRIFLSGCIFSASFHLMAQQDPVAKDSFYTLSPVEIRSIRAGENAPFTRTNISKKQIEKANLGQDIPYLLNQTPAVVVNSDAGNGIGYTGIRIRGTDATRINVTLNGIPYNDAESQGTFFVDLPDILSSAGSIQVQRGVGTSSNGTGAFGASINLSTNETNKKHYAELNNSAGSFGSCKNTVKLGTGLIHGFSTDLRLSRISSYGFIDRAKSRLNSFYLSTSYSFNNSSFRLNILSGKEKTYQAWYGISEADLNIDNRKVNYAGIERPGDPYDNETDNYTQTHYQLFFNQVISGKIVFNTAFFFTKGRGYYEQYKADQDYANYGMPYPVNGIDTIFKTDLVRQLWLDNNYYGNIFSFQYKNQKTEATLGGGYNRYEGNHFGKLKWALKGLTSMKNYYDQDAFKTDLTLYWKQQTKFSRYWNLFYDLQLRMVDYNINGFRNNPSLIVKNNFHFFNPKAGISYNQSGWKSYISFAVSNKEPNRDDFEASISEQPKPERLYDAEFGIQHSSKKYNWSATFYYMNYKDQLVLTGKINDVGAYTRFNIPKSYRTGIELEGGIKFTEWLEGSANMAFSRNKVKDFTEFVDDYDNGGQKSTAFHSTEIAYSPALVGGGTITILPLKNLELSFINKYVSRQYLDNTENENRSLDPFFVEDLRLIKSFKIKKLKEINLVVQVNNLFNEKYEPNGYTFSYIYGGSLTTENFYFPMAGTNFLMGLNIKF